ncbi:hypothetical protein [Rufibacter sp. LB8]|uniref:hypothetical protein n=1 Tax=Rufibacter sp. LB8 TaxID=2777781 RepID=UPI00178C7DF9|nr:hypothetical protein [Rufibacter sp. LB8]
MSPKTQSLGVPSPAPALEFSGFLVGVGFYGFLAGVCAPDFPFLASFSEMSPKTNAECNGMATLFPTFTKAFHHCFWHWLFYSLKGRPKT